jgi:hypothetical protein
MPELSPWDDISVPSAELHVRRVGGGATAVPCFWGRDARGACLFIIELNGDHSSQYRMNTSTVKGICVDLRGEEPGQQRLILTLEKQADRDLFHGLCRTLALALTHASDSASALTIALAHIRRWKTFFSGRGQQLSPDEVRGLFAELTFLLEFLDRAPSPSAAIEAWLGPERSHQDFIFGNTSVEIKSLSGSERNSVRISSEDQLESLNDALFLRIYRLSNLEEASGTASLNELVMSVQARLSDADAIDVFDQKLVKGGYAPIPEYDEPRFIVSGVRTFHVEEGFPRLVRSTLQSGIAKVAYDIQLEAISSFECDGISVFEEH